MSEWLKLSAYRDRLFAAIKRELEQDGHCKSYEGAIEVYAPGHVNLGEPWSVKVHCYVLGPNRHYAYTGKTLSDCVDLMNSDLDEWISESEAA